MSSTLPVSQLIAQNPSLEFATKNSMDETPATSGFAEMLSNSIEDVNKLLNTAQQKEVDLVTGKSENLHDAMISVEKAETALKMMLQFRNKAIDAYQEVLRMPL
jgi:flagellar hook-basal body complex protein FliE